MPRIIRIVFGTTLLFGVAGGVACSAPEQSQMQDSTKVVEKTVVKTVQSQNQSESSESQYQSQGSSNSSTQVQDQEQSQSQANQQKSTGIGDVVNVGKAAWLVEDAYLTNQLDSQFGAYGTDKQGNFAVISFRFQNNSSEAVLLDSSFLSLVDNQGREYQPDTDAFEYIPTDQLVFFEQVNPGVQKSGIVIFTVPQGVSAFGLQVTGASMFSTDSALIDLGA